MNVENALQAAQQAVAQQHLTPSALVNLKVWLEEARYADYRPQVIAAIEGNQWKQLDDAFWTIIPFGTGGRRGRMAPYGLTQSMIERLARAHRAWPHTCSNKNLRRRV